MRIAVSTLALIHNVGVAGSIVAGIRQSAGGF